MNAAIAIAVLAVGPYWWIAPDGSLIAATPPARTAGRYAERPHGTPAVTKHKPSWAIHLKSRRHERRRRRR